MTDAELVERGLEVFAAGFMVGFATLVMLGMLFATLGIIRRLAGIS